MELVVLEVMLFSAQLRKVVCRNPHILHFFIEILVSSPETPHDDDSEHSNEHKWFHGLLIAHEFGGVEALSVRGYRYGRRPVTVVVPWRKMGALAAIVVGGGALPQVALFFTLKRLRHMSMGRTPHGHVIFTTSTRRMSRNYALYVALR